MTKKQYPKLKNTKLKHPFSKVPDHNDILAITEGHNWKPVTGNGRFINANYPPENSTKEELEAIERFWGAPEDVVPLRDRNTKPLKKSERKHKFEPSFL
jgi:hypothetical protein